MVDSPIVKAQKLAETFLLWAKDQQYPGKGISERGIEEEPEVGHF